jgi:O-antigen/teichoic acid export membrane protein
LVCDDFKLFQGRFTPLIKVTHGRFAKLWKENSSFALAAGSGVIAPAIGLLTAPILTRLYSPAEFGVLGTFAAIMAAALSVVNLRYEVAIPLPPRDEEAYSLSRCLVKICLATSICLTGLFVLLAPRLFDDQMVRNLMPQIWWLPLALFFGGALQVLTNFAIRRGAFGELAKARLVQALIGPAVQIGLGAAGLGVVALLLGQAAAQTGGLLRLWRYFQLAGKHLEALPKAAEQLKRFDRFPKIALLPAFINAFGYQLPILLVGRMHGVAAAGLVALIFRVAGGPITIFSLAASQVMVSDGARLRHSAQSVLPLMHRTIRRQFFIALPALLATPLLPWLFPMIFGERWADAGRYAVPLVPALVVMGIMGPTHVALDLYERQDLQFVREVVRILTLFIAVSISKLCGGTMWAIVVTISAALMCNSVLGYVFAVRSVRESRSSEANGAV